MDVIKRFAMHHREAVQSPIHSTAFLLLTLSILVFPVQSVKVPLVLPRQCPMDTLPLSTLPILAATPSALQVSPLHSPKLPVTSATPTTIHAPAINARGVPVPRVTTHPSPLATLAMTGSHALLLKCALDLISASARLWPIPRNVDVGQLQTARRTLASTPITPPVTTTIPAREICAAPAHAITLLFRMALRVR